MILGAQGGSRGLRGKQETVSLALEMYGDSYCTQVIQKIWLMFF